MSANYLTFQSTSNFTLSVSDNKKHWDGTLYYSTDTTTWNVWSGTVITSSVDNKLYLRGTGNTVITGNNSNYRWVLTGSNIECTGNIESLLDWEAVESGNHPSMTSYCYAHLFRGCTALASAPALPAKTLTERCYSYMFYGCTALTSAPALPATTLASNCYAYMFQGCTALASAPALPATTLADYCYSYMFAECRSLTSPPALPATTLADSCYESMFLWCTALTSTPTLPATTLATSCYRYMFQRCTALTSAPALPATTLASNCYAYMFQGCTALASAPALPATTLSDYCYRSMFNGCTGLTTAPSLPATTLANYCYREMFKDCTGLTTAPSLPATTLATYCYYYMFENCTALTSTPTLPATTLATSCYYGMFNGCTGLTTVPSLPATTLTYECYRQMFQYCPKIKVSAAQGGIYQHAWRIPTSGTGTEATFWNLLMLNNTGGTFTYDPSINTTYYVENPPVSGFNITFEENGGTTQTDLTGQTALPNPLPTPTKSGYKFVAWYYESNFQTRAKAGDKIEANTTLYAKWHNLGTLFTGIANAIRSKDGTSGNIRDLDFDDRIRAILPSTAGGSIFTGATIPLTYKNNTHDYENNYEYKSATHNITITGLDGRATITGNGTQNVLVEFDVTSSTTSLKNFTITCVNGEQELTYKGLHAHYGETVTGILTFAYNNITHDGSEGTFDTSGLTANYKFIVTSSSDLPIFSSETTLWNTIYSYQLLNVLMGNFSGTSISAYFMRACHAFNQPQTLPSNVSSIGAYFMRDCYSFNQPLTLPSGLSSIGSYFMRACYAFNQPLTLPSNVSSISDYFMSACYAFNQPLTLPSNVSSIGGNFMSNCYSFNQPLTLPSGVSSIGDSFMYSCHAFNQPQTLPSSLSSIGDSFMYNCYTFNQPLTLPSGLSSIGNSFMYYCYALSTIIWNASVYPTDNNSLSQNIDTKTDSTNGAGIKVYGTKRAQLISALPNRTSSPYRKLINGGS